MKKIFYLLFVMGLVACSSNNKYEKTIADYVQTDKHGTKFDMKFKVLEINETARYTVADSIAILKENFETERAKKIAQLEESLKSNEESLAREKSGRLASMVMTEFYEKNIEKYKHHIDSLKMTVPTNIQIYENHKPDELLAIIVRCKYSIVPPIILTTAEETFDFTLSPDATKCYGMKKVKIK